MSSGRNYRWMIPAVVVALAAGLGAGLWWRQHERRMQLMSAIPGRPALNPLRAELVRRVNEAEQQVATDGAPSPRLQDFRLGNCAAFPAPRSLPVALMTASFA